MKITEHNCETNEVTERDMTKDEISKLEATQKDFADRIAAKETARAALLAKLGITAEEAALLLG